MKNYQKKTDGAWSGLPLLFMLVLLFCVGCGEDVPQEQGGKQPAPMVERAPDFSLKDMDGNRVLMSELKGKPLFLNFWASWCRPCREEMPDVQRIYQIYSEKGLKVYAVNHQGKPDVVRKFIKKNGFDLPVLLDMDGEVSRLYKVFGLPVSYFVRKDGSVAASVIGKMTFQEMEFHVKEIMG